MNTISHTLIFLCYVGLALGHSWVERVNMLSGDDIQVSPAGYSRGNVMRTDPGFSDELMTYQLPPDGRIPFEITSTDLICSPRQISMTQPPDSPRLNANGGDEIVLQFNENGHITKPWNNAPGKNSSGEVFVYGTTDSQPTDTLQAIHNVWTADGSGGDGRGSLLFRGTFDNDICYQYTDAASGYSAEEAARASAHPGPGAADPAQDLNLWCTSPIQLPDTGPATLSLYWVWDWPSDLLTPVQPQIYTTCVDINILA